MSDAEYGDSAIVEKAVEALRQTPCPADPPPQVVAAALAAGQSWRPGTKTTVRHKRIFTMKRILRVAAAVILIAGAVVGGIYMFERSPGVAFAEVRRQIQNARTVTCVLTGTGMRLPGKKAMPLRVEMAWKEPGLMRQEWYGGDRALKAVHIMDFPKGKGIALVPDPKLLMPVDLVKQREEAREGMRDWVGELKKLVEGNGEPIGEKQIDGRDVKGFRVRQLGVSTDIWVEPDTGHPVLMEGKGPNGISFTMADFVFDKELDDSLFCVDPARYKEEGYEVWPSMEISAAKPTEEDLIEGLGFLAKWNDETFPADPMAMTEIGKKYSKAMKEQFKERWQGLSEQEKLKEGLKETMKTTQIAVRMFMFIQTQAGETFRYVGKGIKLGDKDAPVCWYKPKDSETYRVVYGDLSVADVAEQDLPEAPPAPDEASE